MYLDTQIAGFLIASGKRSYDMAILADIIGKSSKGLGKEDFFIQNAQVFIEKMKEKKVWKLYDETELPLAHVLAKMEYDGVKIDQDVLKKLSTDLKAKVKETEAEIYRIAGEEFTIASPKQLQHILFEKLKLPAGKKTKTGYSTDVKVLEDLASKHPLPALIIEYRQYQKLLSTYIDALPPLADEHSRVHTSFNQTIASTGRLSSINPNLQNIPIRTLLGREIRKAFVAEPGNYLIAADYSQIELRLLAHYSGDARLQEAFANGQDIHAYTASLIHGKSIEDVTPDERRAAKTVNFGIIYGMGPFKLSTDLKIPLNEAKNFITTYFETYPTIKQFLEKTEEEAKEHGFLRTLTGRLRHFPELKSQNRILYEAGKREAINFPLQGTAADIIKIAMIRIADRLETMDAKSKLILQVHDELVLEVPEAEVESVTKMVVQEMENAYQLNVPLKVDVGVGLSWFDAH